MTVTLELTPEVEARLRQEARRQGMNTPEYVRQLVEQSLPPIGTLEKSLPLSEAIRRYDAGELTQGEAATLAGLSRSAFLEALSAAGVSPFQYESVEELLEEARRA